MAFQCPPSVLLPSNTTGQVWLYSRSGTRKKTISRNFGGSMKRQFHIQPPTPQPAGRWSDKTAPSPIIIDLNENESITVQIDSPARAFQQPYAPAHFKID